MRKIKITTLSDIISINIFKDISFQCFSYITLKLSNINVINFINVALKMVATIY